MNETQKITLKASLTQALKDWIESEATQELTGEITGYLGDEIERTMADAAIAVLEANYRLYDYLWQNDMVTE